MRGVRAPDRETEPMEAEGRAFLFQGSQKRTLEGVVVLEGNKVAQSALAYARVFFSSNGRQC